jgi:hypothetical protein
MYYLYCFAPTRCSSRISRAANAAGLAPGFHLSPGSLGRLAALVPRHRICNIITANEILWAALPARKSSRLQPTAESVAPELEESDDQ